MAQIRKAFKAKLISILEESTGFVAEDFTFEDSSSDSIHDGNAVYFSLKNNFYNDIYFRFLANTEKQTFKEEENNFLGTHKKVQAYSFDVSMSPGEFLVIDTALCNGERALCDEFKDWIKRAWEEFNASSILLKIDRCEENIKNLNTKFEELSEEYFSIEEAEQLKADLEKLKEVLQEHIQSSEIEEDKKNTEIEKLKTDITMLQNTLDTFNKKSWFSSFYARFSPNKLGAEKRKKILQIGTKGLGRLIEAKTNDSTLKDILDEIVK